MASYRKNDVIWFCTADDLHWEFSNMAGGMALFWPPEARIANRWNSSEQLYQACKYDSDVECVPERSPEADPNVRRRIRAASAARGAKMTQKCAVKAGLVRSDWEAEEVRLKAMWWVLELKVYWNYRIGGRVTIPFGEILQATGDKVIVEVSRRDSFWGCLDDGAGKLTGENKLGEILMGVRSRIPAIMRREFTYPEGWLLP